MNQRGWWQFVTRWLKFNAVGTLGVGVQLAVLATLTSGLRIHYLIATICAVEAAVIHNFVWHERFTWRDRTRVAPSRTPARFVSFHLTNGAVSIVGNLLLMRLLVEAARVPYIFANMLSIAACSLANFLLSNCIVFREDEKKLAGD